MPQNNRARRPRVFRIDIDVTLPYRLVRQQRTAQVKLPFNPDVQFALDLLGRDFTENQLLCEILRGDDNSTIARARAENRKSAYKSKGALHLRPTLRSR